MTKRISTLQFALLFITSTTALASGHIASLEETPLGHYTQRKLPVVRSIPRNVSLDMTPASNQGPIGTCASFTAVACGEHYYPTHRFSAGEFTVLAETQLSETESGDCRPGLYLGKALTVAKNYGFIDEHRLPYSTYLNYVAQSSGVSVKGLSSIKSPEICFKDRRGGVVSYNRTMAAIGTDIQLSGTTADVGYRFSQLYPLHHVSHKALSMALRGQKPLSQASQIGIPADANATSAVKALSMDMPVAVALPIFEGCWESSEVSMPDQWQQSIGWHAVTLTGYDWEAQSFTLKNSWGTTWGHKGFASIPFEYVKLYSSEMVAVGK